MKRYDGYMSCHDWIAIHSRVARPKKVKKYQKSGRQPGKYVVELTEEGQTREVFGFTKSEARAVVKRMFDLSRLPVGTTVIKV